MAAHEEAVAAGHLTYVDPDTGCRHCPYPPAARPVPVVSGTALPIDVPLSAQEIDTEVSTGVAAGESI